MLRYMSFQLRGKNRMSAVLLGLWLELLFVQYYPSMRRRSGRRAAVLRPVNSPCCQRLSS